MHIKLTIFFYREAASIGNNITNPKRLLFLSASSGERKFSEFAQEILVEAESDMKDMYDDGNMMNFINILLKNRNNLSEIEIQDEVTTLIMAVSLSLLKKPIKILFSNI